jgi:hypothetical protein
LLETPIGGNMRAMPLALTDNQLRAVMDAAANVAVENVTCSCNVSARR